MSGIASNVLDTACVSPRDRFALWRESLSVTHDVTLPEDNDPADFDAFARAWNLGHSLIVETRSTAQCLRRLTSAIRADQIDHYIVRLQRRGRWTGELNGRIAEARPGNVMVLDMARPTDARVSEIENVNILLPRDMLDSVLAPFDMHGLVIGGAMAAVLGSHLTSLTDNLPHIRSADAGELAEATCRLVAACLAPSRESIACAREPFDAARLTVIRRYIERHLCSPDLSPEGICKALRLSRSTLYAACEPLGGVAMFIQRRRLERAYAALAATRDSRRISEIAYQHGFVSEAHFSRAFRRAFNCSPRDVRNKAGRIPQSHIEGIGASCQDAAYKSWIHQLAR